MRITGADQRTALLALISRFSFRGNGTPHGPLHPIPRKREPLACLARPGKRPKTTEKQNSTHGRFFFYICPLTQIYPLSLVADIRRKEKWSSTYLSLIHI